MFRRGAYEELEGINWSRLRSMRVSPKQYRHDAETEREDTAALRIGLTSHAFILEPELFKSRFVCYRESKSVGTGARKAWEAFQAEHADKVILDAKEYDCAVGAAMAVLGNPVAAQYFVGGAKEMALQWTDAETGLRCKARVDQWMRKLVELKTTRNILPRMFAQDAARLGYHCQASWYLDGLRAHGCDVDDEPVLVAVQNELPHDVVVYRVPEHVIKVGRDEYRSLLKRLAYCLDRDEWPGCVPEQPIDFDLPEWAYPKDGLDLVMPDGEVIGV
jgi:hypothetical protein